MDTAQLTVIVAAALGGGGFLTVLVPNLVKVWSGRAEQERSRNADMKTQRDDAYARARLESDRADTERRRADEADARADAEARKRRIVQEYASQLRALLYEKNRMPPEWPRETVEDTLPKDEVQRIKKEGNK